MILYMAPPEDLREREGMEFAASPSDPTSSYLSSRRSLADGFPEVVRGHGYFVRPLVPPDLRPSLVRANFKREGNVEEKNKRVCFGARGPGGEIKAGRPLLSSSNLS